MRVAHCPVNTAGIPWTNVQALRARGIEAHDGASREDIAEQFAANEFELVETLDVARAIGSDAN